MSAFFLLRIFIPQETFTKKLPILFVLIPFVFVLFILDNFYFYLKDVAIGSVGGDQASKPVALVFIEPLHLWWEFSLLCPNIEYGFEAIFLKLAFIL